VRPSSSHRPASGSTLHRGTQISLVAAALLSGVALGRAGIHVEPATLVVCAAASALAWRSRLLVSCLMLLAVCLGLWRTAGWTGERQQLSSLIGQTVTITGVVIDDPAISPTTGQVDFKLAGLTRTDEASPGHRIPGELSVHEYPVRLQRGYRVQLTGKVRPGFGNAVAELSFPKATILSTAQSPLERTRQRFFTGIKTALPEPIASFGLGLLVGIRALIPKPMQTELALVGLSHLVAVSGYNLTIIVAAVERALGRFGRGVALVASLWLIGGFLVVTGASASIVRASLVSVLSLLAAFYGRRFNPVTLILLTAAATAAYDPKYLTDLGWLLSFLAFFGILVLAPAVEARLGHPKLVVARLFIESFTAQILTLPLILYFFSQLSIVAPITNLIVLPLVPLAMATSFAAGLAGMIIPPFAGWIAWPALLLLSFITKLVDAFAALPWAGRTDHISFTAMLAMYTIILVLTLAIKRTNTRHGAAETIAPVLEPVRGVPSM
jgi:competence protein ComEC